MTPDELKAALVEAVARRRAARALGGAMTRRLKTGNLLIEAEAAQRCDLCGAVAETRPYGPRGENVCFSCGMKDRAAAERAFKQRMDPT